jgi:hypothetical protein
MNILDYKSYKRKAVGISWRRRYRVFVPLVGGVCYVLFFVVVLAIREPDGAVSDPQRFLLYLLGVMILPARIVYKGPWPGNLGFFLFGLFSAAIWGFFVVFFWQAGWIILHYVRRLLTQSGKRNRIL